MSILEKINRSIGFTRNESYVVLFLVFSLLVGVCIKAIKSYINPLDKYDYTLNDLEFEKLSNSLIIDDSVNSKLNENIQISDANKSKNLKSSKTELSLRSININKATKEELVKIPGIGETTAQKIIEYRNKNGPFQSIDELLNIRGIGKKKLERIKPYCTLH